MRETARYALSYYREKAPMPLGRALLRRIGDIRRSRIPIAVKLGLVITVLIVTGMGSLGIWMAINQNRLMHEQLYDFGITVAQQLAHIATEPILSEDSLGLTVLTTKFTESEKVLGTAVYAYTGELLASAGLQPAAGFNPAADFGAEPTATVRHWFWEDPLSGDKRRVSFVTPSKHSDLTTGYVLVTLSASMMDSAFHKAGNTIFYATLFMCLLASLAALFMSRRLSRPIHTLMEATKAVGRGDLGVRIPERRNDEIGVLIDSFNNMADGLLIKTRVEQMLSRYVSKNVAERILANLDQVRLGSRHVDATVLFADIVGFTSMAER
ncbi:MAG TPA: HAMP domain-containing protein, partial [Gammaproteobacteria bacterium]